MTGQLAAEPALPPSTVGEPMRIGALDVGAVAVQLLIVQLEPGLPPHRCGKFKTPTRLAQHCGPDRSLSPAGIAVVVDAITRALTAAREGRVDALYLYATSVIRDAPNALDVVRAVRRACGVHLSFLSGADEAHLTYVAARRWATAQHPLGERLLVLDIGGGTSELAIGTGRHPELALSVPLGARRLTAGYLPSDPPTPGELAALRAHVRHVLRTTTSLATPACPAVRDSPADGGALGVVDRALATSRVFRQLCRLAGRRHRLTVADLHRCVELLAPLSAAERVVLPGVTRPRAGLILAGAVIAEELLTALHIPYVESCPWGLREGIILRHARTRPLPLPAISVP